MKIEPYSDNIIFMDTEFSTLDPYKGEILSIGLVKMNNEELYLELEYDGYVEPWVKNNIIPTLKESKISREEAKKKIRKFVGKKESYFVGYINQFDTIYWYKLFSTRDHPAYWIPIDFASILFGLGIDPEAYNYKDKNNFYKKIGVDASKYKEHHALDDAKLLREVYLKFYKSIDKVMPM